MQKEPTRTRGSKKFSNVKSEPSIAGMQRVLPRRRAGKIRRRARWSLRGGDGGYGFTEK